jgi:transcriptional regulator with XRE-family HTH domain
VNAALKLRELLASRQLSLNRVSQRTAELFGSASPCHIPHNLYSDLERPSTIPTFCQLFALSVVTRYRLADCIAVFGLQLDSILGFQFGISRKYTSLLDTTIYDDQAWLRSLVERQPGARRPGLGPLLQVILPGRPIRVAEIVKLNRRTFLYARIGDEDRYAVPDFVAGSVIRADPRRTEPPPYSGRHNGVRTYFLIEQDSGWNCGCVFSLGADKVLLECARCPGLTRELRIGGEARILGAVDAEVRRLGRFPSLAPEFYGLRPPALAPKPVKLGNLIRRGRIRQGLSFREASALSQSLAKRFSDPLYFASPSTLSDYETLNEPPRHIQKVLTLCLLYAIRFEEFLSLSGLPLTKAGTEPMPDEFVGRHKPKSKAVKAAVSADGVAEPTRFLTSILERWQELPMFFRYGLDELTGMRGCSLGDLFLAEDARTFTDPLLRRTWLLAVSRRAQRPPAARKTKPENCHVYVLLDRNGRYLCGRCALDGDDYVLYSNPQTYIGARRYRAEVEAELVGRVAAITRRLT